MIPEEPCPKNVSLDDSVEKRDFAELASLLPQLHRSKLLLLFQVVFHVLRLEGDGLVTLP